jgi:tRNA (guanine-N7-)-methyltransferase
MAKVYPVSNFNDYRPSKNPYNFKIREFEGVQVIADELTEKHKGQWRARFGKGPEAKLELELGAYHGETSNHLARTNPQNVHLGIEWKYKMCFMGGKKARDQGLTNVTHLRANIARLPWMFEKGEIDRVWILFPDPWSKLSQSKWRLLQPGFFRMLACLLPEGKELMIKTDHREYSEFIAESLKEAACFDPMSEEKAKANWALIPPTPFERIFLRQSLPIYPFALVRNGQRVAPPAEVQHVLTGH